MVTENRRISDVSTLSLLSREECEIVINDYQNDCWEVSTRQDATSAQMLAGGTERYVDLYHKSRHEQPIVDPILNHKIKRAVFDVNEQVYRFRVDSWEEPFRILRYTAPNDHFVEHVDLGAVHPRRKLAFSMLLSDDFEDGDLSFYGGPVTRTPGVLCVWPSFLRHEVVRIKRGVRYALVGWATGPTFV
jgi:predicted 2-oxoglutarate/Fe(II)-dependent dioxygenase YbiX